MKKQTKEVVKDIKKSKDKFLNSCIEKLGDHGVIVLKLQGI